MLLPVSNKTTRLPFTSILQFSSAPTPTAAAELAVPNRDDLKTILDDLQQRLTQNTITLIQNNRWVLGDQTGRLHRNSPDYQIRSNRQHLDEFRRVL